MKTSLKTDKKQVVLWKQFFQDQGFKALDNQCQELRSRQINISMYFTYQQNRCPQNILWRGLVALMKSYILKAEWTHFFDPPSSETTKSFYKDDSNSLLSFAGLFSFFPVPSVKNEK